MDIPSSGMVDDSGPNLHKPPDYRLYRRLHSLAPERRIPDHVEQVICEASDEEPCLIGCKPMAARFVPSECVLSFFYPVLNLSPAIVDRDYLFRFDVRVGHDEPETRK